MARRRPPARTPSPEGIKAAAARAEKRSKGEEVVEPKIPITPPIKTAARLKKEAEIKRRRGRPTKCTPAVAKAICKMLATGMSIREIGRRPGMPSATQIAAWGHDPSHPFSERFARARETGFVLMAGDLVEISDDGRNDWMIRRDKDGESSGWRENGEAMARSRLRVDTRKWILSKMLPKVYGEKASVEHSGPGGAPIEIETVSKIDVARWIANMLTSATAPVALEATAVESGT